MGTITRDNAVSLLKKYKKDLEQLLTLTLQAMADCEDSIAAQMAE